MNVRGCRRRCHRLSSRPMQSGVVGGKRRKEGKSGWRTGRDARASRKVRSMSDTGKGELVGAAGADFCGDPEGLLYTGSNRGSVEIVAHEVQARVSGAVFVDRSETGGVAEVVLRKSARPKTAISTFRAVT